MAIIKFSTLSAVAVYLILLSPTQGQQCDYRHNGGRFTRTFLTYFDGPIPTRPNRTRALEALGQCRTPEGHTDKMIEYFQTRHGINLAYMRQDPYKVYEDDTYTMTPWIDNPGHTHIVISETNLNQARFLNIPLYWQSWSLVAKKNVSTPLGTIQPNHWLLYGMLRITVDGRDVCVVYKHRNPRGTIFLSDTIQDQDLLVVSEEYGEGDLRGISVVEGSALYQQAMISFPA